MCSAGSEECSGKEKAMGNREKVIEILSSWVGLKEADGSHKKIIDVYNSIKPLPAGYKMKYTDAWCAATISAAYHQAGLDAIFPSECSCSRMIEKAKRMGIWQENDAYTPNIADAVLYDWQDNGVGDNVGQPDHVGTVQKVSGGYIYVFEGNYSDQVKVRKIKLNAQYIRGFITPKFEAGTKKLAPATRGTADSAVIWNYFLSKGLTEYGVAGLMGNLQAESGLKPTNLQNSYEPKLKYNDDTYTDAIDSGAYSNFVKDAAGYGLAQWTFWTRKENLKKYADSAGASIGNIEMQLDFLWKELQTTFKGVLKVLQSAKTVQEASDIVLTEFEKPKDMGASVKAKRLEYSLSFYNKHAKGAKPKETGYTVGKNYTLQAHMFVRDAAAGNKKKFADLTRDGQKHATRQADGSGVMSKGTVVTCQETKTLANGAIWMRVPSGWICAKGESGMVYIK